jgi:uncharacterized hydrophobic protein (TIGR00271 family)
MSFRNSLLYIRYKNFLKQINHKEIYKELDQAQQIDISYIALVVISAHIATLGLIVNSAAVIIGAMIIAPLMGPIMAGGLSFAISDNHLGGKAFKSISLGIVLSVFFSATVTFISPLKENTSEILIRTSPNIMDLFIALFSGLAGAFAVTFKKISGSIVGVAISVALMPPLCVTGIGISTGQANVVIGGFFLFLTNLTAIFIASAIFFLVLGFFGHDKHGFDRKAVYSKYIVSFLLLLLLSIPLIYTLEEAIKEKIQLDKIKNVLVKNFDIADYSRLDSWKKTQNTVYIKINTVTYIPQEKIDSVEKEIRTAAGQDVALDITQIPVFSLYENGRKPVSSLLLEAISGKVSPQQVEGTGVGETKDKIENGLDKSVFEQMKISCPYIDGYQLKYSEKNDLKSIIVTIDPNYSVTIEQVNSVINYLKKINDKIEIKVISDNISLQPIFFEENSFEIETSEHPKLDVLAAFLDYQDQYAVKATGYADSTGGQYINEYFSRKRAETVRDYLMQNANILPDRIVIDYSLESNKEKEVEEGRKSQRRVDLEITPSGF